MNSKMTRKINSKRILWPIGLALALTSMAAMGARAQTPQPLPQRLSGLLNDYTPSNVKPMGPYEMRGTWSLQITNEGRNAVFSAVWNMELSDHGILEGLASVDDPGTRAPHTHHITMTGDVSRDTSSCPANSPATTNPGFMVKGMAHVVANGAPAPFSKNETVLSPLQVCISGGSEVSLSNVTLVFGAPASSHFGPQAIHGVVRKVQFTINGNSQ